MNNKRDWQRPDEPRDNDAPRTIWGVHAVEAALANPGRTIVRMWATDNAGRRLEALIAQRKLTPERVTPRDLDRRLGADTVHQGLLIEVEPLPEVELSELTARIVDAGPLIVLDQVTDPHNVGAILRSAAAFGSAGVVMTRRHSPPISGVLAKSASGALELVPIALVNNLARAMSELKDAGVTLIGLDGTADRLIDDVVLDEKTSRRPVTFVLGAEGRGLRHLTAETCDVLCRIGTSGPIASLNVSNAAAIALHLAAMARRRSALRT